MDSIKNIIKQTKSEVVNNDIVYKMIAGALVVVLIAFAYKISKDGLSFIPLLGNMVDWILYYINYTIYKLSEVFKALFF